MIAAATLLAFVPAALALNLTPGADMMFCMAQGLRAGSRAALAASLGVAFGGMVHVTLAGVGVAAAIAAAPIMFDVIRWVGVGYLLWLAWQGFFRHTQMSETTNVLPVNAFRAGVLVNLTNPKVILFVLAFVPQFVDPTAGPILVQFLIFGTIIGAGGVLVNGLVGHFAGRARQWFFAKPDVSQWLGRITGTIFVALALRLALLQRT